MCKSCQWTLNVMNNLTTTITSVTTGTMCIHCINKQKLTLNVVYCIGWIALESYDEDISVLWGCLSTRTEPPSWNLSPWGVLWSYNEGASILWGLPRPILRCHHRTPVSGIKHPRSPQSWSASFLLQWCQCLMCDVIDQDKLTVSN